MGDLKVSEIVLDEFMLLAGEMTVIRNMINKIVKSLDGRYSDDKELGHLTELLEELHKINGNIQNKITDLRKESLSDVLKDISTWLSEMNQTCEKNVSIEYNGLQLKVDTSIASTISSLLKPLLLFSISNSPQSFVNGKMNLDFRIVGENIFTQLKYSHPENEIDKIYNLLVQSWKNDENLNKVLSSIQSLGGEFKIDRKGNDIIWTQKIQIPKSVLITDCLFVKGANMEIGIPKDNILRIMNINEDNHKNLIRKLVEDDFLLLDDEILPLVNLSKILQLGSITQTPKDEYNVVILRTTQNLKFALIVDAVIDIEDAVVKQLSGSIKKIGLYLGVTFLGEGNLGLIMSVDGIASTVGIQNLHKKSEQWKEQERKLSQLHNNSNVHEDENTRTIAKDIILFELNSEGRYSLPQNDIFRLEEFDSKIVQTSGNQFVIPYRDSHMIFIELTSWLNGGDAFNMQLLKKQERWTTIVVKYKRTYLGLVVKSILDSASSMSKPQEALRKQKGIQGHFLLEGKTIAYVSIDSLLSEITGASNGESHISPHNDNESESTFTSAKAS